MQKESARAFFWLPAFLVFVGDYKNSFRIGSPAEERADAKPGHLSSGPLASGSDEPLYPNTKEVVRVICDTQNAFFFMLATLPSVHPAR